MIRLFLPLLMLGVGPVAVVEEPMPTRAEASRIIGKLPTTANSRMPISVQMEPTGSSQGLGWRSVW